MKNRIILVLLVVIIGLAACGCTKRVDSGTGKDVLATVQNANGLAERQPTPTDIEYSLERYNLIRRTYWVNGMREKAIMLPCEVEKPLGYIVLFAGNSLVSSFIVDGKVSSLNSFLTPDSEYYEKDTEYRSMSTVTSRSVDDFSNKWIADVDGSYGENDDGIFFFTPDGKYVEWTGTYLYSDIPFVVDAPVVRYETEKEGEVND